MFEYLVANTSEANALAAIASVAIALLAFVASIVSLYVSVSSLKYQRRHNVLSVSPIPEITVADYENSLRVKIRNNGSGPLTIIDFSVVSGQESKPSLIGWMGSLPLNRPWTHFALDINGRTIMPGKSLPLLELTSLSEENNFSENRDLCRSWLKDLSCKVEYTNVYETKFEAYTKNLECFARNL